MALRRESGRHALAGDSSAIGHAKGARLLTERCQSSFGTDLELSDSRTLDSRASAARGGALAPDAKRRDARVVETALLGRRGGKARKRL